MMDRALFLFPRTTRLSLSRTLLAVFSATALFASDARSDGVSAITITSDFDDPSGLGAWEISGDAAIDTGQKHEGTASLKLAPGARATLKLRPQDGAGHVKFHVYEDATIPTDPKKRRVGPRWGLQQSDGRILAVGNIYAPYLAGNTTYTSAETPDGKNWLSQLTYLGETKRKKGWRQWTFAFDPDRGLDILCDGESVNARRKRFDWNKSNLKGFNAIVLFGDSEKAGNAQTIWIDSVKADLGGSMNVSPVPPPPPPPAPPATPPQDPALDGAPPTFDRDLLGQHPRLLFGADDIPAMKELAQNETGKPMWDELIAYLGSSKKPEAPAFLRDATDAQRQGLWRLPTVAMHYVLTGEEPSLDRTIRFMQMLLDLDHWETGKEQDSGMGAANIMIGAALAYDWTYHELDPGFREQFRKKLWHHARAMYHGGHLKKNAGPHYWQNDPQNNHRWHRNAGLALCALAAFTGAPEEQWFMRRVQDELAFVARWLPDDGSNHESPSYMIFGLVHLMLGMHASDRCFGTDHLQLPHFKNLGHFRMHTLAPGLSDAFHYGDSGGLGGYNYGLYHPLGVHAQADLQDGIDAFRSQTSGKAFQWGWMGLLWYNASVPKGDCDDLPTSRLFPDMGLAFMRDGWKSPENVAAMFICAPFGGHSLNEYRNENDFRYINVAHDDPDANSFTIWANGDFIAETDRYSKKKQSSNHNTVLINGLGQMSRGRPEGAGWSQPATGNTDMNSMAYLTGYKDAGDVVIVEGEAAGSYLPYTNRKTRASRPGFDRYRRTFIWVKNRYILVLDDIRAPEDVQITWLMQGPKLTALDDAQGRYQLAHDAAICPFHLVSDVPLQTEITASSADHRGKPLGWQQLRAEANTRSLRIASVYNPWNADASVTMQPDGPDKATLTVNGDQWVWHSAPDANLPCTLSSRLKNTSTIHFGPQDSVHR